MIRPFYPRDIFLVKSLQRKCLMLDLERQVLSKRSPLTEALIQQLRLRRRRSFTYILEDREGEERLVGLAQLLVRSEESEGDIVCLAPPLGETEQTPAIWQSLLAHLVAVAGQHGMLRLYAKVPEATSQSIEAFQRAGFTIYTWEDVLKWDGLWREGPKSAKVSVLPQEPHDTWALKRLYTHTTPQLVQQAEGLTNRDFHCVGARRFVLEGEGGLAGALYLRWGQEGSWLRVLLSPEARKSAEALLQGVMDQLSGQFKLPLYCGVRHHQQEVASALERCGFLPVARQCLLARQVAITVKQAVPATSPALEKRAEVVPSASTIGRIGSILI